MADEKISGMTPFTGTLSGTDIIEITVDIGGTPTTFSLDLSRLKSYCNNGNMIPPNGDILTNDNNKTLANKTISGALNTLINIANASLLSGIDAAKIGAGLVSNTVFGYLAGATSNIQAQINAINSQPQRTTGFWTTYQVKSSAGSEIVITNANLQTHLGWSGLAESIRYDTFQYSVECITGSYLKEMEVPASARDWVCSGTLSYSRVIFNNLALTVKSASADYLVHIYVVQIDASS